MALTGHAGMTGRPGRALLFGGSGQIGHALLAGLLASGWEVVAVSRRPQAAAAGVDWRQGDLQQCAGLPAQVDAIFSAGPLDHFAAWHARGEVRAQRVVAFGSTSVEVKQDSADPHERALAARLREGERRLLASGQAAGAAVTVLRPTLVYGAGRDATLSRIAALAVRSGHFPLPRTATGLRQPVHVQDLADAALAVTGVALTHGRAYALPGGETLAYDAMVARVLAALPSHPRLWRVPAPLFAAALAAARASGRLSAATASVVARMRQDLVFDDAPARADFGWAPRAFAPTAAMLGIG